MAKVTMEHISLNIYEGETFYVDIDSFRFSKDSEINNIEVFWLDDDGNFEYLDEIIAENKNVDGQVLTELALKWIIKNVEIVEKVKGE